MSIHERDGLEHVPAYRQGKAAPAGAAKLSSNESPHAPLPSVIDAVSARLGTLQRYPSIAAPELTAALAERHSVDASRVTLGAGSVEILSQLVHALAGPGDEVVYAWRSFEAYPSLVRIAGATPVEVPLTADGVHDLPAMRAAITPRTRMVVVCNPNNPTGTVVPGEELEAFVDSVPRDVLVVIDEAYVHFDRSPGRTDGMDLARRYEHVAVLHTFSKAYGLAGLRVGFAVSPPAVADALRKVALPFGVSDLAQAAAVASLAAQAELDTRIEEVVAQRERMREGLAAAGLAPLPTQANFVWIPAGPDTARVAAALEGGGVVVRAFEDEGLRISVGTPDEVDRVLDIAASMPGQHERAGVMA